MCGYIDVNQPKECSPKVWQIPPETWCTLQQFHTMFLINLSQNEEKV